MAKIGTTVAYLEPATVGASESAAIERAAIVVAAERGLHTLVVFRPDGSLFVVDHVSYGNHAGEFTVHRE